MTTVESRKHPRSPDAVPALENGDRLDQPTFHERYLAMPVDTRAELIEGTVYVMSSPVRKDHAIPHGTAVMWARTFATEWDGLEMLDNGTLITGRNGEVQPDAILRIKPSHGGNTVDRGEYVEGAPELVIEIARSSVAYDLHQKKRLYERAGASEYLVLLVTEQEIRWFVLEQGHYQMLKPGPDGILRSRQFPGLWLD
ncbi:MAG TPA: Uma2 family endonuclease, partial [Armatimonadota bacterium]|nr:Uma2 family endonuclease [Armatimonadota bacterium]